jgi:hypothetical protein
MVGMHDLVRIVLDTMDLGLWIMLRPTLLAATVLRHGQPRGIVTRALVARERRRARRSTAGS